jgi:two-component system response regulator PilR (NtrC family)
VDVRILAATNRDLSRAVQEGDFREDLYYRLAVVPIHLPSLVERADEIPELAHHLLARHARRLAVRVDGIDADAMEVLLTYGWPGNIRELENVLERATALSGDAEIGPDALMLRPAGAGPGEVRAAEGALDEALPEYLDRVEREAILEALARTRFNRTAAAKLLGITVRTLRYRMQRLGIKDENRG